MKRKDKGGQFKADSPQGIEYFTNLRILRCYGNWENVGQLTALDVTSNIALTELKCDYNQLTGLDVSNNTALSILSCDYNQLQNHDVSNNNALFELDCPHNQLTNLDVNTNTALTYLFCYYNQLTSLDVSNNTALTWLDCDGNPNLTEIWLKTGQTITTFSYDTSVATVYYKD